jgi:hypothetical protein
MDGVEQRFSLRMDAIPTTSITLSIKGYGNAIVPQVAYEIFKIIQIMSDEKVQKL